LGGGCYARKPRLSWHPLPGDRGISGAALGIHTLKQERKFHATIATVFLKMDCFAWEHLCEAPGRPSRESDEEQEKELPVGQPGRIAKGRRSIFGGEFAGLYLHSQVRFPSKFGH